MSEPLRVSTTTDRKRHEGKQVHTHESAELEADRLMQVAPGRRFEAYVCPLCKRYHVGRVYGKPRPKSKAVANQ